MDSKGENKEKKHSVKSGHPWAYTTVGKFVRGFFCMLNYMIFISFFGLMIYVFIEFGTQTVSDNGYDFSKSYTYRRKISDEAELIAKCAEKLEKDKHNSSFKIIDVDKNMSNIYNLQDMIDSELYRIDNLSDIKQFLFGSSPLKGDIYDYDFATQIIDDSAISNYKNKSNTYDSYLFFTRDAFKKIFTENGLKNTNHWLSDKFSDSAYIIYMDPYLMQALVDEELGLVNSDFNHENYSLDDAKCAVYDPAQNIYYSSWDDYFNSFSHYIYKVSELREERDAHYAIGEETSSIIFPLLWSENYYDIWDIVSNKYIGVEDPEYELQKRIGSAFLYYIEVDDDVGVVYSNVDSMSELLKKEDTMDYYTVTGDDYSKEKSSLVDADDELYGVTNIKAALNDIGTDSIMYFGIDTESLRPDDESLAASHAWAYKTIGQNIRLIIIGTIVSFLTLILQAVFLIRTTGRRNRNDTEIALNRFDKSHFEVWLLIFVGVIVSSVLFVGFVVRKMSADTGVLDFNVRSSVLNHRIVMSGAISSVVFGFSFMLLVLSLVRRIKAHNLGKRLLIRELRFKVHEWMGKKSTKERLSIYVWSYVGIEALFLVYVYYKQMWGNAVVLIFFVIMWSVALYMVGKMSLYLKTLSEGIDRLSDGEFDGKVTLNDDSSMFNDMAAGINRIGDGLKNSVEKSLKDERMKTELITNVSHDLKTPLTSIINYINLLKTQKMPTPEAEHYIEVLDFKAHRLSQLTEDLVEAAKATSGNIELVMMPISFDELMKQALGEFEDKFEEKKLQPVISYPHNEERQAFMVMADGRRLFRILDNVLQNAYKYALENTRIYIELMSEGGQVKFVMKNISKAPLNISTDELMERFTRGDSSRTTEGSGLGLSIAKDLTKLMKGSFDIELDGDLFKVIIMFPQLGNL